MFKEIWVEEHNDDVRFYIERGNMAVSCMRNENMQYNRYCRNSSVIVNLAIGQIPRSAERISS